MKRALVSFGCGLVFAVGLGLSGMTLPTKVLAFLDVTGDWDPSLALVMGSALAVLALAHRLAPARPVLADAFPSPSTRSIDGRLVGGAAVFGIGWGMARFCPGPALVGLGAGCTTAAIFVVAMGTGMFAYQLFERVVPEPELAPGIVPDPRTSGPRESCG